MFKKDIELNHKAALKTLKRLHKKPSKTQESELTHLQNDLRGQEIQLTDCFFKEHPRTKENIDFFKWVIFNLDLFSTQTQKDELICFACHIEDHNLLHTILNDLGYQIHTPKPLHPIAIAAMKRHPRMLDDLLEHAVRYSVQGHSVMATCIRYNYVVLAKKLFDEGRLDPNTISNGLTPLMWAIKHGQTAFMNLLLTCDLDFRITIHDDLTVFHIAIAEQPGLVCELLDHPLAKKHHLHADTIVDQKGYNLIQSAILLQKDHLVKQLIHSHHCDLHQRTPDGHNLAVFAASMDQPDLAQFFIDQGCDLCEVNPTGYNALHAAVENQAVNSISWLIDIQGFDVEKTTHQGDSALLLAAKNNDVKLVESLIKTYHANTRVMNLNNHHLGHYLAQFNQHALLNALLAEHGISLWMWKNDMQLTMLDVALQVNSIECIRLCLLWIKSYQNERGFHPSLSLQMMKSCSLLIDFYCHDPLMQQQTDLQYGQPVLHVAVFSLSWPQVSALIKRYHLPLNQVNPKGDTVLACLMHARLFSRVMDICTDFSPRLNQLDEQNSSLLHLACEALDFDENANENNTVNVGPEQLLLWCIETLHLSLMTPRRDGTTPFMMLVQQRQPSRLKRIWKTFSEPQKTQHLNTLDEEDDRQFVLNAIKKDTMAPVTEDAQQASSSNIDEAQGSQPTPASESILAALDLLPKPPFSCTTEEFIAAVIRQDLRFIRQVKNASDLDEIIRPAVQNVVEISISRGNYGMLYQLLRIRAIKAYLAPKHPSFLLQPVQENQLKIVQLLLTLPSIQNIVANEDCLLLHAAMARDNALMLNLLLTCPSIQAWKQQTTQDYSNYIDEDVEEALTAQIKSDDVFENQPEDVVVPPTDALTAFSPQDQLNPSLSMSPFVITPNVTDHLTTRTESGSISSLPFMNQDYSSPQSPILYFWPCYSPVSFVPWSVDQNGTLLFTPRYEQEHVVVPTPSYPESTSIDNLDMENILHATVQGDFQTINDALPRIYLLNHFHVYLYKILRLTIVHGHVDVLNELLKIGMMIDHTIQCAGQLTACATYFGQLDALKRLYAIPSILDNASQYRHLSLHIAARHGHTELVAYLLSLPSMQRKATSNHNYALRSAARHGHLAVVVQLLAFLPIKQQAHAFNNDALKKSLTHHHHDITRLLLNIPSVLECVIMAQHPLYTATIRQFITHMMPENLAESAITQNLTIYFLLLKYMIMHSSSNAYDPFIERLLSTETIQAIAHLNLSTQNHTAYNGLLLAAQQSQNQVAESILLTLPNVISHQARHQDVSHFMGTLFAPPMRARALTPPTLSIPEGEQAPGQG